MYEENKHQKHSTIKNPISNQKETEYVHSHIRNQSTFNPKKKNRHCLEAFRMMKEIKAIDVKPITWDK